MRTTPTPLSALLLALAVAIGACSSGDETADSTAADDDTTTTVAGEVTEAEAGTATTGAVAAVVDPDSIENLDQAAEAVAANIDDPAATADFGTYFESLTEAEQNALLDQTFGFTTAEERDAFLGRLLTDLAPEDMAAFAVEGSEAFMSGVIASSTPAAVRELIAEHPEVTTIVMVDVPGSADDVANLEAARLVREAGLDTHVPADGEIASGGVDFYLAGVERTFADGAVFGVHSWATVDGTEGIDVPRDDPQHRLYLDYYAEVGISDDFYWFTLEAAPAAGIHDMTADELARYGFATG
ncbi:MAG: hypothetical protein AAF962_05755 [Actinomycetota bacterium]